MMRLPPRSTLVPYTTLFRSLLNRQGDRPAVGHVPPADVALVVGHDALVALGHQVRRDDERSEEHTSELQSRQYLVCRLLLEKKKNTPADRNITSLNSIHYYI